MVHSPARASKDWRNNTADDRRLARALPGPSQIPLDLRSGFGPESGLAAHRLFKTRFRRFMTRPEAIRKTYGYLKKGSIFVWTQKRLSFSESVTEKTRMAISARKKPVQLAGGAE